LQLVKKANIRFCINERFTIATKAHYISRGEKMRKATVIEEGANYDEEDASELPVF
jgi:hypothetical protein